MHTRFKYILLLALFISAQLVALNHQGQHGGELHQHHDAVCAFSFHKPHHHLANFCPDNNAFEIKAYQSVFVAKLCNTHLSPTPFRLALSRAPPVHC